MPSITVSGVAQTVVVPRAEETWREPTLRRRGEAVSATPDASG